MLSTVITDLIYIFLAGSVVLGLFFFIKKARNLTRKQIKERLKRANYFRISVLLLALLVCAIYALTIFVGSKQYSRAVVSLNYAEASQGQNANGTRYNMSEILCDEVMERTIKKGGFENVSVSDLKSCFVVTPLIEGNSYSEEGYHISTEFTVSYNANSKTKKYPSNTVLELLCTSYRDYYFDKYVSDFEISADGFENDTKGLDYFDKTAYLDRESNRILYYLYGLQYKNSSFVSSTGSTFASVAAKVSKLNSTQIKESLYSFILQNGLSNDAAAYSERLGYSNNQLGFDLSRKESSYSITNSAIMKYAEEMATVVLVPTWDSRGEYYMGRTKVGIDELSVQAVEFSNDVAEVKNEIEDNSLKMNKLAEGVNNSEENRKNADEMISSIRELIGKFSEEARDIGKEYYANRMNQCISATVYGSSAMQILKSVAIMLVISYVAILIYKIGKEFGNAVNDEMEG